MPVFWHVRAVGRPQLIAESKLSGTKESGGTAYKGFSPTLIARQKENHTVLVE